MALSAAQLASLEKLGKDLKGSPEYVEIDLHGVKTGFVISVGVAKLIAATEQVDPVSSIDGIIKHLASMEKSGEQKRGDSASPSEGFNAYALRLFSALGYDVLDLFGDVLYLGFKPFRPDMTRDYMGMLQTAGLMVQTFGVVKEKIFSFTASSPAEAAAKLKEASNDPDDEASVEGGAEKN